MMSNYVLSFKPWSVVKIFSIIGTKETAFQLLNNYTQEVRFFKHSDFLNLTFNGIVSPYDDIKEEQITVERFNNIAGYAKPSYILYLHIADETDKEFAQLLDNGRIPFRLITKHIIMDMRSGRTTKISSKRLKDLKDGGVLLEAKEIINVFNYNEEYYIRNIHIDQVSMFMEIARNIAKNATCDRRHVGAVITTKDNKYVSSGFNTTPRGMRTCDQVGHLLVNNSCKRTIHAEMNAIKKALSNGVDLENCIMYVTHQPCNECAKHISDVGIRVVVYDEEYPQAYDNELHHLTLFIPLTSFERK